MNNPYARLTAATNHILAHQHELNRAYEFIRSKKNEMNMINQPQQQRTEPQLQENEFFVSDH